MHTCAPRTSVNRTSNPKRQHSTHYMLAYANRRTGPHWVNHSESPCKRVAVRVSMLHACLGHTVHGSFVQKSWLFRQSNTCLCSPSVCILCAFCVACFCKEMKLLQIWYVHSCVRESGFPVTLEPAGKLPPDLTMGQRTRGELNSYSPVQNTACNCTQC